MSTFDESKQYVGECDCGREFDTALPVPVNWGTRLSVRVSCPRCGTTVPLTIEGFEGVPEGPEWLVEDPDVRFDQPVDEHASATTEGGVRP